MANKTFLSRKLSSNTYVITGPGSDCYLLEGEDEAIMIDAGEAEENIRDYAQTLTDKPVKAVINTHSHFDHTGGNGYFDVIYGTEGIARSAKNCMGADDTKYPLDYKFTIVDDGTVIPLKGRPLRVILLDCHAPGNITILDETNRMLFSGDEVESGQVLLLPGYAEEMGQIHARHASSVETYHRAMLKLKQFEDCYDMIYPGHNGTPIVKEYLDAYIELAEKIMAGYEGIRDCTSRTYSTTDTHYPYDNANYRRGELKGASLIYCQDLIFDRDYEKADAFPPATPLHVICSKLARQ